jgi:hypothetical protein
VWLDLADLSNPINKALQLGCAAFVDDEAPKKVFMVRSIFFIHF